MKTRTDKIEKHLLITVSTAHVPESLATATKGAPLMDKISAMRSDYGWLISVNNHLAPLDGEPDSITQQISEILHWAKRRGADYVLFDSDGPTLNRFAVYDW